MKKRTARLAGVGATALLMTSLVACAGTTDDSGASQSGDDPIELRYSTSYGATTFEEITTGWFLDEVESRTDGRVVFERFYDGSLIQTPDVPAAMADGRIDVTTVVSVTYPTQFPLWNAAYVPLEGSNNVAHSKAQYELLTESDLLAEEFARNSMKPVAVQSVPPIGVAGVEPIRGVADLEGQQVRALGLAGAMISELGGNPVSVTVEEAYDALERGTVSAFNGAGLPYLVLSGLGEVAPWWTDYRLGAISAKAIVFSDDAWNELPSDVQDIINELGATDWFEYEQEQLRDTVISSCDTLIAQGGGVIAWDESEQDKAHALIGDSLWEIWRDQASQAGISAEDIEGFETALREKSLAFAETTPFDDGVDECVSRTEAQ